MRRNRKRDSYVPETPGGSHLDDLARRTEEAAWRALEEATKDIYGGDREALKARGYTVNCWTPIDAEISP